VTLTLSLDVLLLGIFIHAINILWQMEKSVNEDDESSKGKMTVEEAGRKGR
jgi:hypothetical protein